MNTIGSLKQKQMLFRPVVDGKLTSSRFVPEDLGLNPVISNFITKGQLLTVNCLLKRQKRKENRQGLIIKIYFTAVKIVLLLARFLCFLFFSADLKTRDI